MIQVNLFLDGDGCWPDANPGNPKCEWIDAPTSIGFARLPMGTQQGGSTVTIRVNRPDGTFVMTQTSMKAFLSVAQAFEAKEEMENAKPHN